MFTYVYFISIASIALLIKTGLNSYFVLFILSFYLFIILDESELVVAEPLVFTNSTVKEDERNEDSALNNNAIKKEDNAIPNHGLDKDNINQKKNKYKSDVKGAYWIS